MADDEGREGSVANREAESIDWLLRFLREDVSLMTPGRLIDTRDELIGFCLGLSVYGILLGADRDLMARDLVGDPDRVAPALRDMLSDAQGQVASGLDLIETAGGWVPFEDDAPLWALRVGSDGSVTRRYMANIRPSFVAAAADLLLLFWPDLRRCAHAGCRAWFLPTHGRQRYHSPTCSTANRQKRYQSKRDYAKEHARRVAKKYGKSIHPNRSKKRGKGR